MTPSIPIVVTREHNFFTQLSRALTGRGGARQKFALVMVRTKNKGERKRKRSLSIKAIGQIATSPNTQVIRKQIQFYLVLSTEFIQYNLATVRSF